MVSIHPSSDLTAVLERVHGAGAPLLPDGFLDGLRHDLERAARHAVDTAGLSPDAGPIRLSKARIEALLACERYTLATLGTEPEPNPDLVKGSLLDALVAHHVLGGRPPTNLLVLGESLLEARALDDDTVAVQVDWLRAQPDAKRSQLKDNLDHAIHALLDGWPELSPWQPRVSAPVTVVLADGDVVLSGRLDVCLGGSCFGLPTVGVEIKVGRARQEFRIDHLLYGLLLTLRDGVAPASVVTCSAADGVVLVDPVTEDALTSATKRTVHALDIVGRLAGGGSPAEQPGWRCGICPDNARCPSAFGTPGT